MRYLSVCSGIEAASVAWHPLGWTPHAFAEIEAFPSAVLAHHYGANLPGENWSNNAPPNYGDLRKFKEWPDAAFDVLVGGTPCQSFSVAGLRAGLADPRGNLCLTFLALADRYRPSWILWENVPGVLSSDGGRDFGAFLGGLGRLGYGWAYRVLDAQYVRVDGFARAVPQRRRRVFVVGYLGDWRRAAAVLFERESLLGNPAPRRQTGEGIAPTISARPTGGGGLGTDFDCDGGLVARCDTARQTRLDYETENFVAHSLRTDGFDAGEDGTGRGTPLVPIAFDARQSDVLIYGDGAGPIDTDGHSQAIAFSAKDHGGDAEFGLSPTLRARLPGQSEASTTTVIQQRSAVRRLTPRECERLQGFPDDYTMVPYRGKPAADGPRYKALGNSMAVNVMRWIGRRIEFIDNLTKTTLQ